MVLVLICLGAQRVNGRTFCGVQHPALYECFIDVQAHLAAECIDLPDEMTFACAADGRIAGHHGDGFQIDAEHQCLLAHPGAC